MIEYQEDISARAADGGEVPRPVLSVVIPALNEEDGITEILERVLATRDALRATGVSDLEVIVVDDGSVDATAEIAGSTPGVRLVRHRTNRGYGAALKTGFGGATGQLLAFLDADSTYPPDCLARLCDAAVHGGADIVIGSRRSGGETSMPRVRRLGNLLWSRLLSILGSEKVLDPASGMRVLWRRCLPQLYPLPDGLNFTPVMSTRALHEGLKVVEIPIPYRERTGRSKLSIVRDGMRFLSTIIWTVLEYNPARILELAGFASLTIAGLIGSLIISARINGVKVLGPWGVLGAYGALVLTVGGVSLFSLGISFNYLVSLFHRRPMKQANILARIVGPSPERHFGWVGTALTAGGMILAGVSVLLGVTGWEITRLWFWLLGSALFFLAGIQFLLFRMLIRVLDTLRERDNRIGEDLAAADVPASAVSLDARSMRGETDSV